jgi:uncharacterized protein
LMRVERLRGIEEVDREMWRTLEPPEFPFFDFEFLRALEHSGSIGRRSGWSPAYLVCKDRASVLGALCLSLVARKALAAYLIISALARSEQTNGTATLGLGSSSVGKLCSIMGL